MQMANNARESRPSESQLQSHQDRAPVPRHQGEIKYTRVMQASSSLCDPPWARGGTCLLPLPGAVLCLIAEFISHKN